MWYAQTQNLNFDSTILISNIQNVWTIICNDINNDKFLDLITKDENNRVSLYMNNGTNSFIETSILDTLN